MSDMLPAHPSPTIGKPRPRGLDALAAQTAVSGLSITEYMGNDGHHITVFTFTAFSLTIDDTNGDNFVGQKIYDFPKGVIQPHSGSFYGTLTTTSAIASTLNASKAVQIGFGTATAATAVANILDAACYNVLPGNPLALTPSTTPGACVPTLPTFTSSATIDVASDAITAYVSQQTAIVLLTDSSGGTVSDTLAAITGAYVEATIENTVASLAGKINQLCAAVNGRGGSVKPIDGSSTAADLYVNLNVATDGDIDADATVAINGTLVLEWSNTGGFAFATT